MQGKADNRISGNNQSNQINARVRAGWRARACAAALCAGVQVFLLGTGIAMRISLNAVWLSALAAPPVCALCAALCARVHHRRNHGRKRPPARAAGVLLAAVLLFLAALSLGALAGFSEQALLHRARTVYIVFAVTSAALLCALSGGTGISRLCFALRFLLPGAAFLLGAWSLSPDNLSGIDPLLGPGAGRLGLSCLCMAASAAPVLMLLLPPQEIKGKEEAAVPPAHFFAWRVFAGAAFGALLLFALCACSTYESLSGMNVWGDRLAILSSGQPHTGMAQALLASLQTAAFLLHAACMVSSAEAALVSCFPRLASFRLGLALCGGVLFAALLLLSAYGLSWLLPFAPAAFVPAALCLVLFLRGKEEKA